MFLPRPVLLTAGRRLRGRAPEERRGRLLCLQCPEEVDHLNGALACSMVSVVRTPKSTGTPVSSDVWAMPLDTSAHT